MSHPLALTDPNAAAQQAVLQQQLNALSYSPFGDSPLFRNPLSDPKKKEEVLEGSSLTSNTFSGIFVRENRQIYLYNFFGFFQL